MSMVLYPSVAISTIAENGESFVSASQYRTTAVIATVACLIGAILFLFYSENKILGRISELRAKRIAERRSGEEA